MSQPDRSGPRPSALLRICLVSIRNRLASIHHGFYCDFRNNTTGGQTGIGRLTVTNGALIIGNIGIGGL